MFHRIWYSSSLLLLLSIPTLAQDDQPKSWELSGYVKNLQTLLFFDDVLLDTFFQDNLIHNRLNFSWYINDHWTFKAEARNRIFFGDLVQADPSYARTIDNVNNDYFDLSLVLLDNPSFVIHSMLDRLYLEYSKDDWEVRLGRQRINWGIGNVWNPNDIFNAFAFTDFDYEERPGSDAVRVKYYLDFASSIEFTARVFDDFDEAAFAGLYTFNQWQYDFQFLAGYVQQDLVVGGGWAGNLKDAGFKGEWSYFIGIEEDRTNSFALATGVDYVFSNSIYMNLGYLYNSNGTVNNNLGFGNSSIILFNFDLSARNLYPYRHALFVQASYPITPLLNSGAAIIYSPVNLHPLFVNPTLTYSIKDNWDLDFVGQIVFNESSGYKSPLQALFFRLKYSF